MSKISKYLINWEAQGLISEGQRISIEEFELKQHKAPWIFAAILMLGAFAIGLGIISLIAANWYKIPDYVKLTINFTVLSAIGSGIYYTWTSNKFLEKPWHFEVLMTVFTIHCLASIGLMSQVYHLEGETFEALGLWLVIVAPLILYSKLGFLPIVWSLGLYIFLIDALIVSNIGLNLSGSSGLWALTFFFATLAIGARSFKFNKWSYAFFINLILSFIPAVFIMECFIHRGQHPHYVIGISLLLIFIIVFLLKKSKEYTQIQKKILYSAIFFFSLMYAYFRFQIPDVIGEGYVSFYSSYSADQSFVMSLFTIILLIHIGLFFISRHQRRYFNFAVVLIGFRLIILYFQALGGLATTGIGLILSGIIIISLASLWTKNSSRIATRVQGWLLNEK